MDTVIILLALIIIGVAIHFLIITTIDKEVSEIRNELREIHRTIKHTKP